MNPCLVKEDNNDLLPDLFRDITTNQRDQCKLNASLLDVVNY